MSRPSTWRQLVQNRFWLIVPVLAIDLVLVGRLPPPLAPGSPGPEIPGWLSTAETVRASWSSVPRC